MVLPQDAEQAAQASNILAEREYQAKLAQYKEDEKKYEEELKKYNEEKAKYEAEQKVIAAEAARIAQAKADFEKDKERKLAEFSTSYWDRNPGSKGTTFNRLYHEYKYKLEGGSQESWNQIIAAEDANRKLALRQSAGLRAVGNAQISQAQQTELARLGGSGSSGPTSVSGNISQNRVGVASGEAAKAQDFSPPFQAPIKPIEPKNNAERFAQIATHGTSLKGKPDARQPTIRNHGMNPLTISPYLTANKIANTKTTNTVDTRKPDVIKQDKAWAERLKGQTTQAEDKQKANLAFAELNKPQEIARHTPWVIGDKGFFTKEAAENSVRQKEGTRIPIEVTVPDGMFTLIGQDSQPVKDEKGRVLQFKTEQSATRYAKILNEQGNELGYSKSGEPIQGPVQTEPVFAVSVPTLGGKVRDIDLRQWEVDGKTFGSEKQAQEYIEEKQMALPLTTNRIQNLTYFLGVSANLLVPGINELYQMVDSSSRAADKIAKEKPYDFNAQINSAALSFQGGILNMVTTGGSLIDKYVLKQETAPTRPVNTPITFETVALENTFKGVESVETFTPLLDIRKEDNILSRYLTGAKEQIGKQTLAQNLAQGIVLAPVIAYDVATLGQGGLALLRSGGRTISKIATSTILKSTVANAETTAILNAPARVVSFGSKRFENPIPNPYGKERRIPYAIKQGVERIGNIKNPIKIPYNLNPTTIGRKTILTVSRGIQYVQDKVPTLPAIPQGVKDVGIRVKLAGQDLKTQTGIVKRDTQLGISRGIQYGQDVLERRLPGVPNILRDAKYRTQIGISNVKEKAGIIKQGAIVQYRKAQVTSDLMAYNLGKKYGMLKKSLYVKEPFIMKGTGSGFPNLYRPFEMPRAITNIERKIKNNAKILGENISNKSRNFSTSITLGPKIFAYNARKNLTSTKKNILSLLPEEYRMSNTKATVPYGTKNYWNNITRPSGKPGLGKPSDYIDPIKIDKSPLGYSTRKIFGEVSKASARQKLAGGIREIGNEVMGKGRKWMDEMGKFPNRKDVKAKLYGKEWEDYLNLDERNLMRRTMQKDGTPSTSTGGGLPEYFSSKTPTDAFFNQSGIPRIGPFPKGEPSPLNIRKGALPTDEMSKTNVPILGINRSVKPIERTWGKWADWAKKSESNIYRTKMNDWYAKNIIRPDTIAELNPRVFDPKGRNPFWKVKKEPTQISKESDIAADRMFKQGIKEPTTKGNTIEEQRLADVLLQSKGGALTNIGVKSKAPSIKSSPKAKTNIKEFDNPITKLSESKPKMDRIADKIQYGMSEMFKVKSSRTLTKIDRVINKFDDGTTAKEQLNKIQIRAKEKMDLLKDESLFKYKGSKELAIGDKKGVLGKIGGTSKPDKLFKMSKIENWKPRKTDKELEKELGKADKQGQVTRIINETDKKRKRSSPTSSDPFIYYEEVPTPKDRIVPNTNRVLLPPIAKIDTHRNIMTATRSNTSLKNTVKSEMKIMPKLVSDVSPKLATDVSPKLATQQTPKLSTRITPIVSQKPKQTVREKQVTPTPTKPQAKLASAPVFRFKQPLRSKLAGVPRVPPKVRAAAIGLLPPLDSKNKKAKKGKKKVYGFLGNTKLDSIEGLFRRSDIIYGDKKIAKQIRKDKRAKFGEGKVKFFK